MKYLDKFWSEGLTPFILYLHRNTYLRAMRQVFFLLMPFIVGISFFDALESLVLDPHGLVMGSNFLNLGFWLTGGLTGEAYQNSATVQFLRDCHGVINVGYGAMSLLLVMAMAGRLAVIWRADRRFSVFCALAALMFMTPPPENFDALMDHFVQKNYLSALLITLVAVRLFAWLSRLPQLNFSPPACMPKTLRFSLGAFPAVLLTLTCFIIFSLLRLYFPFTLEDALLTIMPRPFFQEPLVAIIYQSAAWFLWWCGLPGHAFTAFVQTAAYLPAQLANQAGEADFIFTTGFFEVGMIHVLALLVAVMVFSRHGTWRSVSKFCLPFMLFNVQEPFVFGLPVVLNPIFFLPYILAPLANTLVGWAAISWGVVPTFHVAVPWTMPAILGGIIATDSLMGGVLQGVWLVLDIFIYAPFVIMANMADFPSETETENEKEGEAP
ncbi:MAG: PTS sugar transporter subunit IIC [Selenomonadaceae bacterium]|nr:PTS sugar transporter subunit IIC [Selenomonadaceae bacterium]